MRAIIVAVDYLDLLRLTLPYNRHHFESVCVVCSAADVPGMQELRQDPRAKIDLLHVTDAFYRDGAVFNKFAALEEGLDQFGRAGWLCIMDADVLWPKELVIQRYAGGSCGIVSQGGGCPLIAGSLYTPLRRMWNEWPLVPAQWAVSERERVPGWIPPETAWSRFDLHRQQQEFAGYTQIFHADDPALGPAPWHGIDWKTAGSADSFFQQKWPDARKIRPPFEVLHLGPAGVNWAGRASTYADGSTPERAEEKKQVVSQLWRERRKLERAGVRGLDKFSWERIQK